jgi:RNA polymerase sigma-70 factor (ECF subfamily)
MASERDATVDELVLRDLAWVKDLARRLLGDPEQADDVAHDAWLAARTRPPAQVEGGMRAWMATVVHHGVQRLRRSDRRRRTREAAVAAAAATTSAVDVVERGALCRELTAVVMDLDEPFRTAILLRYLDGLSTAEVAARQGVSPVALRKRLSRALQLLRERLDVAHAGGFAAWGVTWRSQFGLAPAATASGGLGAMVWIMNGKLLLTSIAALVAVFLLWQWWPASAPDVPAFAQSEPPPPAGVGGDPGSAAASSPLRVVSAAAAVLEVVDAAGVPQAQAHVFALSGGALVQHLQTDAAGRALLPARSTDELMVALPGVVPLRLRRDASAAVQRVVFAFGAQVDGHVRVPAGPHEQVVLRLEHDRRGAWSQDLDERVLTQLDRLGIGPATLRLEPRADGAFRFAGLGDDWTGALTTDGAWLLQEPSGHGCLDDATTLLLLQPVHDLQLELTPPFQVHGRLLAGEVPAAGLLLHVVVPEMRQDGGLRTAVSGTDGRFTIAVPRPRHGGTWSGELLVASVHGDNLLQRRLTAPEDQPDIDVGDLGVGRSLVFVVSGADGTPLAGAEARVVTADGVFVSATTDAQGRAALFGVPPQATAGSVVAHGHRLTMVPLPAGGEVTVRLLAGNGVDLQVVEPDDGPATGLLVRLEADCMPFAAPGQVAPGPGPFAQAFPLDAQGRWQFADLFPGVMLRLVVVDELGQQVGRAEVVAPPMGRCDPVTITIAARTFHCEGRVRDEHGRPVPRVRLHAEHDGQALTARSDADGHFQLGPLRAPLTGVHLEAEHPAFVAWLQEGAALRADVPLEVVLARGRTLRAHVRQQSGAPVRATDVWLVFDDAPTCIGRVVEAGEVVFERAAARPGRLVVRLAGRELAQPVDALTTDVDVRLPNLGTLSIGCAPEPGAEPNERVCLVLTPVEPAGEVDRHYLPRDPDANGPAWLLQVPAGRYRLALEARRLGGGRARVRELGTPQQLDVTAGVMLQVVLP